jgi:glycosyltransferase involved in cell wall biosynthesis
MSARRKVLVIIGQLEVGGTERHLLNVLPRLRRDSLNVTIYSMRAGGSLENEFSAAGIETLSPAHHSRRWVGLIRTAFHLTRTLRTLRPEVVHFFLPEAYLLGGLCSLFAPSCVRLMSRRSLNDYQRKWPFARSIEKLLHTRMNGILANSKAVLADLEQEGVNRDRCAVIYNGVAEPARLSANSRGKIRRDLGLADNVIVLIMVANFIPYKGHRDLLSALAIVRGELPEPWKLLLIGNDRGIEAELRAQARAASLDRHVIWLGAKTDPLDYLSGADIALLTSHEEGFSNAILEAMAVGLPLIVTDVGGNREAVVDGDTGIVVPAQSSGSLARAIVRLASAPLLRDKMARSGHERVISHYHIDECARRYENLYMRTTSSETEPLSDVIAR